MCKYLLILNYSALIVFLRLLFKVHPYITKNLSCFFTKEIITMSELFQCIVGSQCVMSMI